mgnify:FL=1
MTDHPLPIMKSLPKCSSCRAGELTNPADWKVSGHDGQRPFCCNLCIDHFDMVCDDGATISKAAPVSVSAWAREFGTAAKTLRDINENLRDNFWAFRLDAPRSLLNQAERASRYVSLCWERGEMPQ